MQIGAHYSSSRRLKKSFLEDAVSRRSPTGRRRVSLVNRERSVSTRADGEAWGQRGPEACEGPA